VVAKGRPAVEDAVREARAARFKALRVHFWPKSHDEAAEALGIGRLTVRKYESGENLLKTSDAKRPFLVTLGLSSDDLERYLDGVITLKQLLGRRREPDGRQVLDFSDPEVVAAAARGIGIQRDYDPERVESFIQTKMKNGIMPKGDEIGLQLANFMMLINEASSAPPSSDPPFLRTKRKRP
jgi:hypothetical protein